MRKIHKISNSIALILGVFLCQDMAIYAESCLRVPVISELRKEELKDRTMIIEADRLVSASINHDVKNKITGIMNRIEIIEGELSKSGSKEVDICDKNIKEWETWLYLLRDMPQIFDLDIFCDSLKEHINNTKNLLPKLEAVYLDKKDIEGIKDDLAWLLNYKDTLLKIKDSSDINEIITCANNIKKRYRMKSKLYKGGLVFKRTMPYESIIISAILLNLNKNAVEARSSPYAVVKTSKKGNNIIIEFSDTGRGMTREVLENIGSKGFSTKDPESSEKIGMGIWMTLEYLKKKGGSMEIDTKTENGDALRLTFDKRLEERTISISDRTETGTTWILTIPAENPDEVTETFTSAIGNLSQDQSGTRTCI